MGPEHEFLPPPPEPSAPKTVTRQREANTRMCNDWLQHWRGCDAAQCRRARRCLGDASDCFLRHWHAYPPEAQAWVRCGIWGRLAGQSARRAAEAADVALISHVRLKANLPFHNVPRRWRQG